MIRSAIRAALAAVLSPATGRGQQYVGQTLDLGFDNDTYRILADGTLVSKKFSDIITFSRASNATRFSPTGQLEYAPHNLLLQSQTFDNASWGKVESSISANTSVSPDGSTTAETWTISSATAQHYLQQAFTYVAGITYVLSVYVKKNSASYVQIGLALGPFGANAWANFDVESGVLGTVGSAATASITDAGNGWYRCSVGGVCTTGAAGNSFFAFINAANATRLPSYTGNGTDSLFIWGAQLAVGPYPLDYTPTTTAVVYGPRFDYDPTTLAAKGLLIEEQRTNSIRNNTMVGAVAGTPGTLPTNWQVSTASGLTTNVVSTGAENGINYIDLQIIGTTSGTQYTINQETGGIVAAIVTQSWSISSYIKQISGSQANISSITIGWAEQNSVPSFLAFNLGTVSVSSTGSLNTNRKNYSAAISQATTAFIRPAISLFFNSGVAIDITLRIGLPQLEQGAFATSVIPTTTAATTRSADVASIGTLSPWYNATEGTVVAQFSPSASAYSVYNRVWQLGTIGNYIAYAAEGTSSGRFYVYSEVASATQVFAYSPAGAVAANSANRQAFAYKLNDYAWSHNGGSAGTDTSATVPSVSVLSIGQQNGTGQIGGWIQRLTYTPRRLTNAELAALTS